MATTIHSFMDIFDTTFGENQEAVQLKKIVILFMVILMMREI